MARRKAARFGWAGGSRGYREPEVKRGEDLLIPETRQEVLSRIIEKLDKDDPFLQQYSNGEFTSSSLTVAYSFEECKKVRVLETPGYTVHKDPILGIFWRRCGQSLLTPARPTPCLESLPPPLH